MKYCRTIQLAPVAGHFEQLLEEFFEFDARIKANRIVQW